MFSIFLLVYQLLNLLQLLILARVIISFVPAWQRHPVGRIILVLTEPMLAPLRRITTVGGPGFAIDFSPMLLLMIISFGRSLLGV